MDFDDITLGEIEEIEEYAGLPITDIGDMQKVGATKLRTALAWIIKRRENPDFTIQDAKNMKSQELFDLMDFESPKKA